MRETVTKRMLFSPSPAVFLSDLLRFLITLTHADFFLGRYWNIYTITLKEKKESIGILLSGDSFLVRNITYYLFSLWHQTRQVETLKTQHRHQCTCSQLWRCIWLLRSLSFFFSHFHLQLSFFMLSLDLCGFINEWLGCWLLALFLLQLNNKRKCLTDWKGMQKK